MRAETSSSLPRADQTGRPTAKPAKPRTLKKPTPRLPTQSPAAKKPTKLAAKKSAPKKPAKKSRAAEQARILQVLDTLDQLYPDAHCELNFNSPFELLIAVILSAQCTDDRVNLITPELFRRYPDPQALASSDPDEVERIIYSTGFFRNK